MKFLTFGSLNNDYVYDVDHFNVAGETQLSNDRKVFCGGKGLNQSIAIKRSGTYVYHAGSIGISDSNELLILLEKESISTKYIQKIDVPTGHAIIQNNIEGENSILLFGGANQKNDREHINNVLENFGKDDVVILQNEISNVDYIIKKAKEKSMKIVLNPSPINDALKNYPIELVDLLVLNSIEAKALTSNDDDYKEQIKNLSKKYPNTKILLTLGKDGSIFFDGCNSFYQPIVKTNVIDTTGAGDTFLGYFTSCYFNNMEIEKALKISTKASSLCVSKKGASPSIPYLKDITI